MSLKAELETWANALKAYDDADFEASLDLFSVRLQPCFSFSRSEVLSSMNLIAYRGLVKDIDEHGSHIRYPG
jgi:hypothetical protein